MTVCARRRARSGRAAPRMPVPRRPPRSRLPRRRVARPPGRRPGGWSGRPTREQFDVHRHQRSEVDHLDRDALLGKLVGRLEVLGDHVRPGHKRHIRADTPDLGLAEGDQQLALRHLSVGHVEQLVLDEHDGLIVADRGLEQALRIAGVGGIDHLEAGDVMEHRLEALRVLPGQRVAGSTLGADHQRDGPLGARHEAVLGGLVDDLVHREHQEVDEQDLDHRPAARDRRADAEADEPSLAERRVDDPPAPNSANRPSVTLYDPLRSPMPSPITNTDESRGISSSSAARRASRYFIFIRLLDLGQDLGDRRFRACRGELHGLL